MTIKMPDKINEMPIYLSGKKGHLSGMKIIS
jgi:hypothetical protein